MLYFLPSETKRSKKWSNWLRRVPRSASEWLQPWQLEFLNSNALLNSYFTHQACHLYRLYLKRRSRKNCCYSEKKRRKSNNASDRKSIIFVSHRRGIYTKMPSSFHHPNTRLQKNSGKRPDLTRKTSETFWLLLCFKVFAKMREINLLKEFYPRLKQEKTIQPWRPLFNLF